MNNCQAYISLEAHNFLIPSNRCVMERFSCLVNILKIVIFVLSAQSDCFLLGHENEFLVETVRSRLQTHSNAPTKQSSCARNTNTIFSTTAF
jgi:hypothetical protein